MTFIAAEPKWRCVGNQGNYINSSIGMNSTGGINGSVSINSSSRILCPLDEAMGPGHKNYSFRCNIPRDSWEFVDDFTSVVTQVSPGTGAVNWRIGQWGRGEGRGRGCRPKGSFTGRK